MKLLHHPNCIRLIETIETRNNIYIVTDLMKDGDLFDYIKHKKFLEEYEASLVMKQLIEALIYTHDCGIIHRDIKPFNIMISDLDTVKICDFGLSKIRGETFPGAAIGMRIGSPHYAAPEQAQDPESADERSDIYSVGVLLYRMLSGELPSMKNISLSMVNPLYDSKWDLFFRKSLGLTKESRFASASEMLYALKHLSVHWENVKEQECALTPADVVAGQKQASTLLRNRPVRKAGKHARQCFDIDSMSRPLAYTDNQFYERDPLSVIDGATGLIWQTGGSDNPVSRRGADQYIVYLNEREFAGINSWRLPTVNELISLFTDTGNMEQYCRVVFFDSAQNRLWSCDWRSDITAWYVNTELEFVDFQDENCFYYVRAVSSKLEI